MTDENLAPEIDALESTINAPELGDGNLGGAAPRPVDPPLKPEPVTFTPEQQAVFDKAMNKKTGLIRDETRKAEALQTQLDDAKSKIPTESRPEIPEMPDRYAEDFLELMAIREKAILDQAGYDAGLQNVENQRQYQAQQDQAADNEAFKARADSYSDRAGKLGVDQAELEKSAQAVMQMGLNEAVLSHIIDEPLGPQIAVYLAQNPEVGFELSQMSPMQAAVRISSDIAEKAKGVTKAKELAPAPATHLNGGGQAEGERGPKGATYE